MRTSFDTVSIGAVARVRSGYAFKSKDWAESGVPVVKIANVKDGELVMDGCSFVSRSIADEAREWLLRQGDILIAMTGYIGDVARVRGHTDRLLNQRVGRFEVVADDACDSDYLYYVLRSDEIKHDIKALGYGSAQPNVSPRLIQSVKIPLPRTHEQRAIASVLGALDDKIEQNRRRAQALERLARAIFRAWFVDFEPVKAKAAGATCFPSMPQSVFDALPTRFVGSAIGPVPEGWGVLPLANVATFLNGLALQKYPPRGDADDLPVIKIAQLRKGSTEGADLANGDVPAEYVIGDGDLLFSWSGTLEAAFWFGGKGALNQHLFKVTSGEYPSWLCLLWIHQHLPWFRAIAAGKATTMGHIKRGHLTEAKIVIATPQVLQTANDNIGRLHELYAQTMLESRKLAEMRDYLLPRLLSGNVRVEAGDG